MIYISRVFEQVKKKAFEIESLLVVDNLGFIVSEMLVKEIAKALEEIDNLIVEWKRRNMVTYNIVKIKFVLFFFIRQ